MKKILLVDDDTSILEVIGDFLVGEGYSVVRAGSGEEALALLRGGLAPDLIILDMMMPGIGGMGVLERIGLPDGTFRFPLLVLTAKSSMAEYFADKKIDGFLAKPCAPEDLAGEVSRIIFQTAGAIGAAQSRPRTIYVADPLAPRRQSITAALAESGYAAMDFDGAAALVQEAVTAPPSAVAIPLDPGGGIGAAAVASLLRGMPATAATKVFVYGIGEPGADIDAVVALNGAQCVAIPGTAPDAIVAAIDAQLL